MKTCLQIFVFFVLASAKCYSQGSGCHVSLILDPDTLSSRPHKQIFILFKVRIDDMPKTANLKIVINSDTIMFCDGKQRYNQNGNNYYSIGVLTPIYSLDSSVKISLISDRLINSKIINIFESVNYLQIFVFPSVADIYAKLISKGEFDTHYYNWD
jgi:hypothetical protein